MIEAHVRRRERKGERMDRRTRRNERNGGGRARGTIGKCRVRLEAERER